MWKLLMKNISAFSENRNKSQETDWLCLEPIINPNLNKDTGEVTEKSNVALIQWGSGKLKNKNRRCIQCQIQQFNRNIQGDDSTSRNE